MSPQLPPPDPNEQLHLAPGDGMRLQEPVAVFVNGGPAADDDRVADALLDLRPGLLIVCAV